MIDNGSSHVKIGIAETGEYSCIPCFISRIRPGASKRPDEQDIYFTSFRRSANYSNPKCPIDRGVITNWDDMETIWDHALCYARGYDPNTYTVLVSDHHIKDNKRQWEMMAQILFEKLHFESCYISQSTTLATYAAGRTTGAVIDCGESATDICCVYEGCEITGTATVVDIAGRDITQYLMEHVGNSEKACEVKEKYCYVSPATPTGREMPPCSLEDLEAPEMLFSSWRTGRKSEGIGHALFNSIMKCDEDIRNEMFANIILSGGTTMVRGFPERIEKEIRDLAPPGTEVNVIAQPDRHVAVWRGGCALASLDTFPQMAVSYDDRHQLHRRCW